MISYERGGILARLRVSHLLPLVVVLGAVLNAAGRLADNSFLWHVRAGSAQLAQGEVLRADPFSFTMPGAPWRTQSWLAELLYGWLEGTTGGVRWHAMLAAFAGATALALLGLAVYAIAQTPETTALVLLPVMLVMFPALVPRPAVFALPLTAALVLALAHRRLWWTVVPLVWVWAAVHGSFVFGLGLIVLEAGRTRRRRLAFAAAAAAGAASVTAHGLAVWAILIDFFGNRRTLSLVSEWEIPDPTSAEGAAFALVALAALAAAVANRAGRMAWLVAAPVAIFGFSAARNLAPAAIVLAVPAASWLRGRLRPAVARPAATLNWAIAIVLVGASVAYLLGGSDGLDRNRFPQEIVAAIDGVPTFHDDSLGGYLIYAAWPGQQVFIDDRVELYEDLFAEAAAARSGIGYDELFARFGVEQAVAQPGGPLYGVLLEDGWIEVIAAGDYVLLQSEKAP